MAAKKIGVISINLTAGTAAFISDLDKANTKVAQFGRQGAANMQAFGHAGVTSVQATSGSLRLLEGNFNNNIRATEVFLSNTLGLGGALKTAFPLVGGLAFAGLMSELIGKATDFFVKIQQAPERIAGMFRELNAPLRSANDEMRVANDRLEIEIAKLEGKRQNTLKLALDEAKVAADKLADSLDQDLSKMNKLIDEQNVSVWKRLLGQASTQDVKQEFAGGGILGSTGYGGFRGQIAGISDEGNDKIREAKTLKEKDAAQTAMNTRLLSAYGSELSKVNSLLSETQKKQAVFSQPMASGIGSDAHKANLARVGEEDQSARIEVLKGVRRQLQEEADSIRMRASNTDLTAQKEKLQADRNNEKLDRPFQDRIKAMRAQLEELRAKASAVGQTDAFKGLVEGKADALKIIEQVNKALEKRFTALNSDQKAQITDLAVQEKQLSIETAWATRVDSTTRSLNNQIVAQTLLTNVIGKGYAAVRAATVETELMSSMGEQYSDPARAGDVERERGQLRQKYDAEHSRQIAGAIDKLGSQIELERSLAAVQSQGADVIRRVALAYRLRDLYQSGAGKQIKAEIDLFNAQQANLDSAGVASLQQKITDTERLAAAQMKGAEAARLQGLENKYADMERAGRGAEVPNERKLDQLENQMRITQEALSTSQAYRNGLEVLRQQLAVVTELERQQGATRDLEVDRQRIEDQIRDTMAKQALQVGTLKDGLRAFFTEAGKQAEKPGQILYDGLNRAVDGLSESLAKLLTGQKGGFAQTLKGIAESMLQSAIKGTVQKGLGALGKKLGFDLGDKPDFTASKPGHVLVDNFPGVVGAPQSPGGNAVNLGANALFSAGGGFLGKLAGSLFGSLFGGASKGFSTSSISFPGFASGGDAPVGSPYWVGENGPELRVDRSPGSIIPRGSMGGDTHNYYVDARGATDPALTVLRVTQGMQATHDSAVRTAMLAVADRQGRVPR